MEDMLRRVLKGKQIGEWNLIRQDVFNANNPALKALRMSAAISWAFGWEFKASLLICTRDSSEKTDLNWSLSMVAVV